MHVLIMKKYCICKKTPTDFISNFLPELFMCIILNASLLLMCYSSKKYRRFKY